MRIAAWICIVLAIPGAIYTVRLGRRGRDWQFAEGALITGILIATAAALIIASIFTESK